MHTRMSVVAGEQPSLYAAARAIHAEKTDFVAAHM